MLHEQSNALFSDKDSAVEETSLLPSIRYAVRSSQQAAQLLFWNTDKTNFINKVPPNCFGYGKECTFAIDLQHLNVSDFTTFY